MEQTTTAAPSFHHRLAITGMSCAGCVAAVETALRSAPGVAEAQVNFADRTAQITANVPAETLIQAVRAAGYDAAELRDEASAEAEREAAEQAHYRRLLRNTVVAGD